MGKKVHLFASVAVVAILFTAPVALAGDQVGKDAKLEIDSGHIGQSATNTKRVVNGGLITTKGHNLSGRGASLDVSASGARSIVGVTSIQNNDSKRPSISTKSITQSSANSGPVVNIGAIAVGSVNGNGTSLSIGAGGATSAIGVTSINDVKVASLKTGNITQTATNYGPVVNLGIIRTNGSISGTGASASISAAGATAAVSVSIMK